MESYYKTYGTITDPGPWRKLLCQLPAEIPALVAIIQGLFMHVFWAEHYGASVTDIQKKHTQMRFVSRIMDALIDMDNSRLEEQRSYDKRFCGNCRDFAVFLTALLRCRNIPARARCGFALYFIEGKFEDHWICEYWDGSEWVGVDAQLDSTQQRVLGFSFDPLSVPRHQFLSAARAWQLCRKGEEDPEKFGIFNLRGLWFIRSNLIRDLAALNKMELLPWDCWGLMEKAETSLLPGDIELLDRVADLIESNNQSIFSVYESQSCLKVPGRVTSYSNAGKKVEVISDLET